MKETKFGKNSMQHITSSEFHLPCLPKLWIKKRVDDICVIIPPKIKMKTSDYKPTGKYPIIDQSQDLICGYTDIEESFPQGEYILFGDHTCCIKYADFPFVQGADGLKVLKTDNNSKFIYYALSNIKIETNYNRHWSILKKLAIPIPPLEEQERIASALTAADNLIASLDKQITKMRNIKQGTMQHLLSSLPSTTPHKPLGSISEMQRGTSITKKDVVEGAIPVISGGQTPAYYCNMSNREGKCITVAGSGEYSGFVAYWDKPIFVCDAFSIKGKKQCITKYLFYVLRNMQTKIYATKKAGGGVPHVFISSIDHFLIPIPPIEEQERIASILTAMDNQLEALEAKRNKYEMLKQGMMQQLLTGNIRLV